MAAEAESVPNAAAGMCLPLGNGGFSSGDGRGELAYPLSSAAPRPPRPGQPRELSQSSGRVVNVTKSAAAAQRGTPVLTTHKAAFPFRRSNSSRRRSASIRRARSSCRRQPRAKKLGCPRRRYFPGRFGGFFFAVLETKPSRQAPGTRQPRVSRNAHPLDLASSPLRLHEAILGRRHTGFMLRSSAEHVRWRKLSPTGAFGGSWGLLLRPVDYLMQTEEMMKLVVSACLV